MKHFYIGSFLLICVLSSLKTYANLGDTTIVTTSPVLNADNSASFDSLFIFPTNKTYRKIFLVYTVNSHSCPAGSQYCHQWDYIGNVTLKPPHGDTVELARIITPFATSGWSRFPQPPNWSEDYVFDVTDFAPYFNDTLTINSALGVGSPGYGIYTKFIFIEGTPDRNTTGITRLYAHGGTYGNASNPINNNFPVLSETAPAGTASAAFRFIVSGHGSDANECCEFASHYYQLYLNGNSILQQQIWRDCGSGELYPQGGTWLYNRSNWCPGASVIPYYDPLPGIAAGTNYNLNIEFEPYTVTSPSGNYDASATVVYYGNMNKTLDASVEEIIAPTSAPQHFRENPSNNTPIIHIHNSGSTAINSVAFQYGVVDSQMQQYTWDGTLGALADTTIYLPALTTLANMSASSQSGTYSFIVSITGVNGSPDQDQTNDTMRSQFIVAPNWPDTIIVKMLTSNLGADGQSLNSNPADANWYITNAAGDTVLSRTNTNYSTLYNDTLSLPGIGYYKFTISTPAFCAGLHWWPYDQGITGYAPGYLQIKGPTGTNLAMHGYTYATNTTPNGLKNEGEHDDFGCMYFQYFYVKQANLGINNIATAFNLDVYPNPADGEINIDIEGITNPKLSVSLMNILGQVVYTADMNTNNLKINTSSYVPGVYTLICNLEDGSKKIEKVVIRH